MTIASLEIERRADGGLEESMRLEPGIHVALDAGGEASGPKRFNQPAQPEGLFSAELAHGGRLLRDHRVAQGRALKGATGPGEAKQDSLRTQRIRQVSCAQRIIEHEEH